MKRRYQTIKCFFIVSFLFTFIPFNVMNAQEFKHCEIMKNIFSSMKTGDKAALLMVHFGTTHNDTRIKTIDVLNEKMQKSFPQLDFYQAWTSRIILKRINARGERILNPRQALQELAAKGYTHVIIQSSHIINGVEMQSLYNEVKELQYSFKDLRLGTPLLYAPEDYKKVARVIAKRVEGFSSVVMVGHGTYSPSTAQYAMMDYVFQSEGFPYIHVATIEGFPSFEDVLIRLDLSKSKELVLMPFLFVAGDHATNDIAVEWREEFEKKGYEVKVLLEGLGEQIDILDIYVDHVKYTIDYKRISINEQKNIYSKK